MGWHVGNGREQMATFYPASQFRKTLYRPDVIKRLLGAGSLEKALALADAARGKASEQTEIARVLPPEVQVASPRSGATLDAGRVEVKAISKARGGHPVTALRLLLDGRPYKGQAGVTTYDPAPPRRGPRVVGRRPRAGQAPDRDPGRERRQSIRLRRGRGDLRRPRGRRPAQPVRPGHRRLGGTRETCD